MAAKHLNLEEVPTIRLTHLTDDKKRAFIIADNKIALSGEWDYDRLSSSGQETYNKLCEVMGVEPFDDEDFGDDKRFDDADERIYDED